jgi:hypothetical protein
MTELRAAAIAAAFVLSAAVPALAQPSGTTDATTPKVPGAMVPHDDLSDATITKVGAVLRQTVTIRQKYAERAQSIKSPQEEQALEAQAQTELVQAVSDQGLSVQQYNQVIQMAQADPTLKQRLLSLAKSGG